MAETLEKPQQITFDVTDRCQLRCVTCSKWKTVSSDVIDKELTTEEWKKVLEDLKNWLGEGFWFCFSGGEPFLRPDIFEIAKSRNENPFIVILDEIEDPHNMGSIIRTAVCAGFDAVIFPSRRNAIINATVEKSSAGAVNHIDLIMVNSLVSIIDKLKDNNFWIIATDINAKDNYYEIDYCDMNFAIVMGSEKEGISSSVLKQADYKIKIPMLSNFDSLNVANAASIVIYEAVKQLMQKSPNVV